MDSDRMQPPIYNLQGKNNNGKKETGQGLLSRFGGQQHWQTAEETHSPFWSAPTAPVYPQEPIPSVPSSPLRQALDAVRTWSERMSSVYGYTHEPPPPPMELYHPPAICPTPSRSWKRSHAMRVAMQRRRRVRRGCFTGKRFGLIALFICLLLLVVVSATGSAFVFHYFQKQMPKLEQIANQRIPQTTRIYDRNNVLLFEWYDPNPASGGRRTPVRFNDIPQVMRDALVAAEDKTFWTNTGVDPLAIVRASSSGGGASTITQQLIKNLTGNDQRSYERKMNEAVLAIGLTQQYPKWKILEMYFNVAPFDSSDRGVEAAAEKFFGLKTRCDAAFHCSPGISRLNYNEQARKDDPALGLARASILAGMPQSPYIYDPTNGPEFRDRLLTRQQYVLDQMVEQGYVTREVARQAHNLAEQIPFQNNKQIKRAPHFVDWIRDQMAQALGNGDYNAGLQAFLTGGFNIRTTIDANLQDYVERSIRRHLTQSDFQIFPYPSHYAVLNRDNNVNTASVVVMHARTGEILAMSGGLDYNNTTDPRVAGNVNVAINPRSPGSTFKPFVYATAFQMGWYPGIVLSDVKTYFPNGEPAGTPADKEHTYAPPDYGGEDFHWNIDASVRLATAMSLNVPAVKALSFTGLENVLINARRMGITSLDNQLKSQQCAGKSASACLGIATVLGTHGVSLLQMVGAYQTFANEGTHVPEQSILDIWDNYGHNLYHFDPAQVQGTPVFSPQVSYMMTSILTDEHARQREFAGDHDLSFWDWDTTCRVGRAPYPDCLQHQVAAKTGTTDNFRDNWTIGYTPNVVVGVWAGNANGQPMLNIAGISGAAPIWHSVMEFVSGRPCAEIDALIKCPNSFDRRSFHFSRPDTFTQPPGLQRVCTSNKDGLSGSGNCDWVIAGQAPQQSGLSSSPPPDDSDNPAGDVPPDQNNDSNNNNNNNANNNNSNNNMNNASPNDG